MSTSKSFKTYIKGGKESNRDSAIKKLYKRIAVKEVFDAAEENKKFAEREKKIVYVAAAKRSPVKEQYAKQRTKRKQVPNTAKNELDALSHYDRPGPNSVTTGSVGPFNHGSPT